MMATQQDASSTWYVANVKILKLFYKLETDPRRFIIQLLPYNEQLLAQMRLCDFFQRWSSKLHNIQILLSVMPKHSILLFLQLLETKYQPTKSFLLSYYLFQLAFYRNVGIFMFRNQVVRQETAKGGLSYVFLGWLFKLVFKNQLDIHIKKYFSKILQKCKKCNKGLLKYLMIILGESGEGVCFYRAVREGARWYGRACTILCSSIFEKF